MLDKTTNDDRAEWAEKALDTFAEVTGLDRSGDKEDKELLVGDMISDLMHYCDREGLDWSVVTGRGGDHYREEKWEDEQDARESATDA